MLHQGMSLAGIGAVLRHRSPDTTGHYAKVDLRLLAEIAQPWPEGPSWLTADIERYISLRQSLGFRLHEASRRLRAFGHFATERARHACQKQHCNRLGHSSTVAKMHGAFIWKTSYSLHDFLHGEDPAHEIPPERFFHAPRVRPLPYIYAPETNCPDRQGRRAVSRNHILFAAQDLFDVARPNRSYRTPHLRGARSSVVGHPS